MKWFICTVLDIKADSYMQPWFISTVDVAKRSFIDCVNDPDHAFGKHPEDYHLVKIGIYHANSGTITPEDVPFTLLTGTSAKRKAYNDNEEEN